MILEEFGLSQKVLSWSGTCYAEMADGRICFPLRGWDGEPLLQGETLFPDGRVRLVSDFFFSTPLASGTVQNFVFFSSVTELLAFAELRHLNSESSYQLVAFGLNPDPGKLREFLAGFRCRKGEKQVHLAFGNDLIGRVNDIRLACRIRGLDVRVTLEGAFVCIQAGKYRAVIKDEKLSLFSFCRQSGFRTRVRTVKAKGFAGFWEQLQAVK